MWQSDLGRRSLRRSDGQAERGARIHLKDSSESRNRRQIWLHSGVIALAVQNASLKADHAFVRRLKDLTSSIEPARSAQLNSGAKRSQLTGLSCPLIRLPCRTPGESARSFVHPRHYKALKALAGCSFSSQAESFHVGEEGKA